MATLDRGQLATERSYADVQRRLKRNYRQAVHEVQQKMDAFNQRYKAADIEKRKQLSEGKITKSDYDSWKRGQVYQGKLWQQKRDSLTETLYQADVLSTKIVNGERLNVFTANANHICYNLEHTAGLDFGFSVYDNATVSKILKDEPTLLPPRKVKHSEDVDWYHKIINNCVTQGIIQGESIPEIAKRIAETTGERGEHAAIRNARTAMTAAQNAGRIEAMHAAQALGIKLQKRWLATLDNRTRDSHQHLDGQVQNVDDPFESDYGFIMFPGDPWAEPADVYNCRCTLLYEHPEYPSDIPRRDNINGEVIGDMTYDEWIDAKQKTNDVSAAPRDNSDIIDKMRGHNIFNGLSDNRRDIILDEIRNGDRQYAQRALDCMDNAQVDWNYYKSCYSGNGQIHMRNTLEDNEIGRTFWHEYGHFIDDADSSNSGIVWTNTYTNRRGIEQRETIKGATWIADYDDKFKEAADKDINNFLRNHGLNYTSKNGGWIYKNDGTYLDPRDGNDLFGVDAQKIQDALTQDWKRLTGQNKAEEYLYKQGYPRDVSLENYGRYYTTPVRKQVKFKWNDKNAEQEYRNAMTKYYQELDKFKARPDIAKINAEVDRLTRMAEDNERNCGGVTDTFDGLIYGLGQAIINKGGHSVDYYMRDTGSRIRESVANIHEQVIRDNKAAEEMYKELCPNVYSLVKGALDHGL